jgi:uncharacterized protein (TIGR02246 family)
MRRTLIVLSALLVFASPSPVPAGPKEDVAAATQAWADAVNGHDPERVVVLYDPEAVLWGTSSPTIRDSPSAIRDYFRTLPTFPPEYRVVIEEQRVRVYGNTAINSGTYTLLNVAVRDGKQVTIGARFSFVYRNRDGRWVIVDHHSSRVPAPPPPQ